MTTKLWGGRFSSDITSDVLEYTLTVDVDERLIPYDIWGSVAHVLMLGHQEIVSESAASAILGSLLRTASSPEFRLRKELEDVHLNIERHVIDDVGEDVGGRMHTARSRNDQVATDLRLYLRDVAIKIGRETLALVGDLAGHDAEDTRTIIPGYTHSQAAQPVTVAFWRAAHASMLLRGAERLRDALARINLNPLGGAALAGTSFPIDRELTAVLLGFPQVLASALDATSTRDHVLELAAHLALGDSTLSRMAEEIVVWSGHEYRLCEVGDEYATGSSIMPQKKNPVVAELIRGRTGRSLGALVQLHTAVKGVTLGYSCDLQEDKPQLWQAIDSHAANLRITRGQLSTLRFDRERGESLCWDNFSTATELANYLVSERDVPFREAHHIVGTLVGELITAGSTLRDADRAAAALDAVGVVIEPAELHRIVHPRTAVENYRSAGSTSSAAVRATTEELLERVALLDSELERAERTVHQSRERTFAIAEKVAAGVPITSALDTPLREPDGSPASTDHLGSPR